MVRVFAVCLLLFTLLTGCAGQARKPTMVIGGALAVAGFALTAQMSNRDCDTSYGPDLKCTGEAVSATVIGLVVAGIGTGLLVGAGLAGGESSPAPATPEPMPAPQPIAEAPASDPANPPPAMEPEPSAW